ncbi:hypothetical protein [Vibrio coralliilyticus]|uniref:hypothetical protein n=1 Tax=Vibrio coralliilyticus TaxID=190893 RepID=UPI0015614B80|nr:hypothetical protein [Vibrio coralliilyticus]NRF14117.1 hypothetical protein [Vibrio coralliilyticus]
MSSLSIDKLFTKYHVDELHRVTDAPGIYCWYGSLKIEPVDWSGESDEFIELVSSILGLYRPNLLSAEIRSTFGLNWNSDLKENGLERWRDTLFEKMKSDDSISEKIEADEIIISSDNRKLISEFINVSQDFMSSPLYIGRAYSLKKRLNEHKEEIDSLFEMSPKDKDQFYYNGESFAERAYGAGFSSEELVVYTLDIRTICDRFGIKEPEDDMSKKIVLFLEYMLNRMYRPVLGKL